MRGRSSEVGLIADAVQVFKEALVQKRRLDEGVAEEGEAKARRARRLEEITQLEKSRLKIMDLHDIEAESDRWLERIR